MSEEDKFSPKEGVPKGVDKGKPVRKDKGDKPAPSFRPGAFTPLVPITTFREATEKNTYMVDPLGMSTFAERLAVPVHATGLRLLREDLDFNQVRDSSLRMHYLLVSKKLSYSMDPETASRYPSELGIIRKVTMLAPHLSIKLADTYGYFDWFGARYEPENAMFSSFDFFVKATYAPGQDDIPNDFNPANQVVVNVNLPDWRRQLMRFLIGRYERWANATTIQFNVNIGGQQVQMGPPRVTRGFNTLIQLLQAANAPQDIIRVGGALAILEALAEGAAPEGQALQALRNMGVVLVQWDRQTMQRRWMEYHDEVQEPMRSVWLATFQCNEHLEKLEDKGQPSQLVTTMGDTIVAHPYEIGLANIEVGMILQNDTRLVIKPRHLRSTSGHTLTDVAEKYIAKHKLG